ncbi:MAG: prepilin peptidase [Spirochaetes bacterium]|nr:prepilin peptidase [Spirochaetota bacterium]
MTSNAAIIDCLAVFFFGMVWGSFFYTLALRVNAGDFSASSLVKFSRCPSCGTRIGYLRLVPILGYLISLGRCASCGGRISPLYPSMEALYGIIAVALAARYGITPDTFVLFLIAGTAICISVIDITILAIPGHLVAVLALLAAYPAIKAMLAVGAWSALGGVLLLGGFFLLVLLVFPGSFGGGDAKFSAAIGLAVGFEQSIVVLEVALVTGAVMGIVYALVTKKGLRIRIPFAPFLTAGLLLSLLYGREILMLYNRIVY